MAQDRPGLEVQIPKPGDDRPRLTRVAVITLVGFVIGVAWPRLAGVKLVPSAPIDTEASAPSADDTEPAAPASALAAPPAAKLAPAGGTPEPKPADPADQLDVSEAKVTSCRDAKGGRKTTCDAIDVDASVRPKILTLLACPAAKDLKGKLSLGIELDFASGKVTELIKGKSTTLPDATADALLACGKKEFASVSLADVKHQSEKYTLFYLVEFAPPAEQAAKDPSADANVTPASGQATVGWEVAIVRDQPKDGEIIARLMRGTKIIVSGRNGDWYRIKYDAKGAEGWVFRTAIGM